MLPVNFELNNRTQGGVNTIWGLLWVLVPKCPHLATMTDFADSCRCREARGGQHINHQMRRLTVVFATFGVLLSIK